MVSNFHQRTYSLIGKRPRFATDAQEILDLIERRESFKFPKSMREWYSLENILLVMGKYNLGHHLVGLENLLPEPTSRHDRFAFRHNIHRVIPVLFDQQGCGCFGVGVDGSDDPVVLFQTDDVVPIWIPSAHSFAAWVFEFVLRWQNNYFDTRVLDLPKINEVAEWHMDHWGWILSTNGTGIAPVERVTERTIQMLQRNFVEIPFMLTGTDHTVRRFQASGMEVLIIDDEHWILWADSDLNLLRLSETVWNTCNLSHRLRDVGDYYTDVLHQLKSNTIS